MKTKMNEKQIKALECLDKLTAYASENKVPMRIMDELEECKKQIISMSVDWTAINLIMVDLLNSIEQKVSPQTVQKVYDDNEISVEMIKEELEKMAGRCRADNMTSIDSMTEQKNMLIKMNCEQLMDISHTKAHLDELKNENLYLQFFQKCKTGYENSAFEMLRELLRGVSGNYNHMLNHMKSMFQSIGGYKNGIGNEKFYYEYEERRTGIDHRVQGEMRTADTGGDDILSFGKTTNEKVRNIVNKLIRKKKLLAWTPVLVVLSFLAIVAIGKIAVNQSAKQLTETIADTQKEDSPLSQGAKQQDETTADTQKEDSILGDVADITNGVSNIIEGLDKISLNGVSSVFGTFAKVLFFIIVSVTLLYVIYIQALKKWCNHQICKQCGKYLETELLQFEQTNKLSSKLDAAMETAVDEYDRQYLDVLNNLFQDSQYGTENNPQADTMSEFDALRAEWSRVRNM